MNSSRSFSTAVAGAVALLLAAAVPVLAAVPAPPFTAKQAEAGAHVYAENCAQCHDADLNGKNGPALIGVWFVDEWSSANRTIDDLRSYLKSNMPKAAPGSLSDAQYIDLTAFLLRENEYKPGKVPLGAANLRQRLYPADAVYAADLPPRPPRRSFPIPSEKVQKASTARPDDSEILHPSDADWLMYNHTLDATRYSKLEQINRSNAAGLGATCIFQLGELGAFEAAPVVYDGVMYITSPYNTYAVNPTTCRKLWVHVQKKGAPRPSMVSRGVAIYKGKVFRVTPDCHVLALDAKTGALLWDVLLSDVSHGYWMSAAPVAYDGKVFIGEAGADWGANAHIYALDAQTGKVDWRFNVIPTGNEVGADSWKAGAEHGGGSTWSSYTLQPENGLLYVSIGNPAPDFIGAARPGENLFTNSVVVLDYRTGKLAWWVQQVPHDVRDWDTAAAPIVYDQDGKGFMAVANKGGWLYVYDRADHKLLAQPEVSDHMNDNVPLTVQGGPPLPRQYRRRVLERSRLLSARQTALRQLGALVRCFPVLGEPLPRGVLLLRRQPYVRSAGTRLWLDACLRCRDRCSRLGAQIRDADAGCADTHGGRCHLHRRPERRFSDARRKDGRYALSLQYRRVGGRRAVDVHGER
jgi:alcohol dehydrogenase (cytochrome c)